jgi:hypothetical protein
MARFQETTGQGPIRSRARLANDDAPREAQKMSLYIINREWRPKADTNSAEIFVAVAADSEGISPNPYGKMI